MLWSLSNNSTVKVDVKQNLGYCLLFLKRLLTAYVLHTCNGRYNYHAAREITIVKVLANARNVGQFQKAITSMKMKRERDAQGSRCRDHRAFASSWTPTGWSARHITRHNRVDFWPGFTFPTSLRSSLRPARASYMLGAGPVPALAPSVWPVTCVLIKGGM